MSSADADDREPEDDALISVVISTATMRAGNNITPGNNSVSVTINVSLQRIE